MKKTKKLVGKRTIKPKGKSEFEKYLEKIEKPDYPWAAKDLPEKASSLEKAKYSICEKILGYQEDNQLSDEKIARQIGLNKKKTLQILFCWIEEFTLDELIFYANKLFTPTQIQVVIREVKPSSTKRLHARSV